MGGSSDLCDIRQGYSYLEVTNMVHSHSFQLVLSMDKRHSWVRQPEGSPCHLSIQIWLFTAWLLDSKGQEVEPTSCRLDSPKDNSEKKSWLQDVY